MSTLTVAERDAADLIAEIRLIDPQLAEFPRDPAQIAEALGIRVYTLAMREGASGALRRRADGPTELYLSAADSRNRQRFTCAHELGHFYRRRADDETTYDWVDYLDAKGRAGTDPTEIYANAFAACLLMPAAEVHRNYRDETLPQLARRFGVSEQAMSIRLTTLNLPS